MPDWTPDDFEVVSNDVMVANRNSYCRAVILYLALHVASNDRGVGQRRANVKQQEGSVSYTYETV